jgi:hypothetical protein
MKTEETREVLKAVWRTVRTLLKSLQSSIWKIRFKVDKQTYYKQTLLYVQYLGFLFFRPYSRNVATKLIWHRHYIHHKNTVPCPALYFTDTMPSKCIIKRRMMQRLCSMLVFFKPRWPQMEQNKTKQIL